jgi:dTDP-glucose 4,6-dehydratase
MNSNPLSTDLDHILEHTRELWAAFQGERLFITGGTGFFGCWLLESFTWAVDRLNLETQAVVLTRDLQAFTRKAPHLAAHPALRFCEGDVRSFDFPQGNFTHIIHAATESSAKLNAENPLLMLDTIVEGTRRTLEFARRCGATNFLLTSSGAVYGKQPPEMSHIPEDYPGAPDPMQANSAYGEGKRMAEQLCTLYARQTQLQPKIARCFAFVGPYLPLDIHFAVGNFIRDGFHGGPILVNGDGTPYRSYLYASDLVIWLWTILWKGTAFRPYNVGSEQALSIADLAHQVAEHFQPKPAICIAQLPSPNQPANRYVPQTQRARNELGLETWSNLSTAIQQTIRWYIIGMKWNG